jgi:hypothetical protein
MCNGKRFAFYFISLLACSSQFMTSTAQITCSENAFDVQVNNVIPPTATNLDIVLFLQITLGKNVVLPSGVTFQDYALECISTVFVKLESDTGTALSVNLELKKSDNLNSTTVRVPDVAPLTQYKAKGGYIENRPTPNKEYTTFSNVAVSSCFAAPSEPRNLKATTNADRSVSVSWEVPEKLNAPSICYYKVETRTKDGKYEVFSAKQIQLEAKITKPSVASVKVTAYNNFECYVEKYPFGDKCEPHGTEAFVNVTPGATTASPATTARPTTTKSACGKLSANFLLSIALLFLARII